MTMTSGLWDCSRPDAIMQCMSPHPDSESALSLTGVVVSLVVATVALSGTAQQYGIFAPKSLLVASLLALQLAAFVLVATDSAHAAPSRAPALLLSQAFFITVLYLMVESPLIAILGIIWVVQATEIHPRKATWLTVAAIAVFGMAQAVISPDPPSDVALNVVTLGLFHVFALITSRRFQIERQLREEAAELNRELMATREQLALHSRQEERLRIARDLHDSLGHHMTALILQLEVTTHHTDGGARRQVQQSLDTAKKLLRELRSAVSELREEDPVNLDTAIARLADNMPTLTVHTTVPATSGPDDPLTMETLLRCIQEALTNIARHSTADSASITLRTEGEWLHLTVHDNGAPSRDGFREGHGLSGMRERLEAVNGCLSCHAGPDGFTLNIRVPHGVNSQ